MADGTANGGTVKPASYPHIFLPGKIGGVSLTNRAMVAPLTRASATPDGHVTPEMIEYYREYGRGGWGLVYTEAAYIDLKYSQGYINQPGVATREQMAGWRKVVDAVHREGAPIFLQIYHGGAVNQGNNWVKGSIAPSPVPPLGAQIDRYYGKGPFQTPREITRDEMREVVKCFADAARRGIEAGFDGVEVHGANGYLPDQFLTTYTNTRTDEYGGPIQNRVKFHVEIMQAMRQAVPHNKAVGVRISQTKVNDLTYVWPGGVGDAEVVFGALAKTGIDFIHVSAHLGVSPVFDSGQSLAALAKRFSGLTIIANGKLQDPAVAETVLAGGEGDFFTVGKGALADPAWARKIAMGETPIPFDQGMISPLAIISNTAEWRRRNGLTPAMVAAAPGRASRGGILARLFGRSSPG